MITDDLIDWPATVPLSVQDKLQAVRDLAIAHAAARRSVSDERREARGKLERDRAKLAEYEASKDPSKAFAAGQTRSQIERTTKLVAKLTEREEAFRQAWAPAHHLAGHLERYVSSNFGRQMSLYQGDEPQLKAGETAAAGHERAARRTRTLRADRQEVRAAPFPSAVAKKLAHMQLSKRAEAAKPNVSSLIDRCGEISFPKAASPIKLYQHGGNPIDIETIDPVGVLAWLFPSEMRAAIDREIDAISEDEIALSAEQRIERLAQIAGDILASEREEAVFAELAGVLPRPDIDPRAALGLSDTMPVPAVD